MTPSGDLKGFFHTAKKSIAATSDLVEASVSIRRSWLSEESIRCQGLDGACLSRAADALLSEAIAAAAREAYGRESEHVLASAGVMDDGIAGAAAVLAAVAFREAYPNVYLRHATGALMRLSRLVGRETGRRGRTELTEAFERNLAEVSEEVVEMLVGKIVRQYYDMKSSVVDVLLKVVRYQDEYTQLHTLRVGLLAEQLAEAFFKEKPSRDFCLGVQMHDLGKVGIPQELLRAPRSLTDAEYAIIQRHPAIGADLLSEFEIEGVMLDAAMCHHERWDGTGYPLGLAGDNIPLTARLIGVADAFDAMTSGRPYRPQGMSLETARALILGASGTQFDPDIARLFMTLDPVGLQTAMEARLDGTWQ